MVMFAARDGDSVAYNLENDDEKRAKRESDMEELGLDNVSFEVPTIMRVNETHPGDLQVSAGNQRSYYLQIVSVLFHSH